MSAKSLAICSAFFVTSLIGWCFSAVAQADSLICVDALVASSGQSLSSAKATSKTTAVDFKKNTVPKNVSVTKLSSKEESLSLSPSAVLFEYGIKPEFDLRNASIESEVPFVDGHHGWVVERSEHPGWIQILSEHGEIDTVDLNAPQTAPGFRYVLTISTPEKNYPVTIWMIRENGSKFSLQPLHRLAHLLSGLSRVELENMDFIRVNPFAYGRGDTMIMGLARILDIAGRKTEIDLFTDSFGRGDAELLAAVRHEAGHAFALKLFSKYDLSADWDSVIKSDNKSVSEYGDTNRTEDFAESFEFYFRDPKKFKEDYPARCAKMEYYIQKYLQNKPIYL